MASSKAQAHTHTHLNLKKKKKKNQQNLGSEPFSSPPMSSPKTAWKGTTRRTCPAGYACPLTSPAILPARSCHRSAKPSVQKTNNLARTEVQREVTTFSEAVKQFCGGGSQSGPGALGWTSWDSQAKQPPAILACDPLAQRPHIIRSYNPVIP